MSKQWQKVVDGIKDCNDTGESTVVKLRGLKCYLEPEDQFDFGACIYCYKGRLYVVYLADKDGGLITHEFTGTGTTQAKIKFRKPKLENVKAGVVTAYDLKTRKKVTWG